MTQQIVDLARQWIGTPYYHQASSIGVGTDCLGLIRGIWRDLYGAEPTQVPAYTRDWDEMRGDDVLWSAAAKYLQEKTGTACDLGDVLLFQMRKGAVAKHLGIQSEIGETPKFIHAYSGHCVTESPLSAPWQHKIVARFRFPLKG